MTTLSISRITDVSASYLDRAEPKLRRDMRALWVEAQRTLTADVLKEMYDTGVIPNRALNAWSGLYARFVVERVAPTLGRAVTAGGNALKIASTLDPAAVEATALARAQTLFQGLAQTQRDALSVILRHHIAVEPLTLRDLSNTLRPVLGLIERDAQRVLKMREVLKEEGVPPDRIEKILTRTMNSAQKLRADTIARTELAAAYNAGTQSAIENAVREGAFDGPVIKEWRTQKDELTCKICGPLNLTRVGLNENFSVGLLPPAHPRCRCVILYRTE